MSPLDPPPVPAPPRADREIGGTEVEELRRTLVPEPGIDLRHVAWAPEPLLLGEGWDNTMWDVGSLADGTPLALRVPRRERSVGLLARELLVLRHLAADAPALPLRIPRVLATSDTALLGTWFTGRAAAETEGDRLRECGVLLARTLARIHRPAPPGLARNPVRGCPLLDRDEAQRRDLARVDLPAAVAERVHAAWARGIAAPAWTGRGVLLHGDPHPANVVLADDGGPPVLIDLGDTGPGDPASDVGALALFAAGPAELTAMLEAYRAEATWEGVGDDTVWEGLVVRARAWSARLAVSLLTAYTPREGLGRCAVRCLDAL